MHQDWKKIYTIQIFSIIAFTLLSLGIIFAVFAPMMAMFENNEQDPALPSLPTKNNIAYLAIVYLSIIFLALFIIMTFSSSIMILATKWNHEQLKNKKVKWGLLSIFLLGPIGNLVFYRLAIKVIWSKNTDSTILIIKLKKSKK